MSAKRKFDLLSSTTEDTRYFFYARGPHDTATSLPGDLRKHLDYLRETSTYEGRVFMASLSTKTVSKVAGEGTPLEANLRPVWNASRNVAPFRPKHITLPLILTSTEKKLFELFRRTNAKHGLNTTVRVAGGWVRDKLMGKDNDDIDVALDDMTGAKYAQMVHDLVIEEEGGEKIDASGKKNVSRVGIIKANPDQSKHLETATMVIYGQELDFVNLRSETYTDNSRIPDMKFGTAKNDATRRDFTINALFYNVNSGSVEDFTGLGLPDLKDGVFRTPLDPHLTFDDDPLRILRAIKFASRYAFRLDEHILSAISIENVRMGITTKCSQERVGKELASMLSCKRPVLAFRMMDDLQLWPAIYGIHGKEFKNLVVYKQGEGDELIEFECSAAFWASQFKLNVSLAKLLGWTWYSFSQNSTEQAKSPQLWSHISTWLSYNGFKELSGQDIPPLRCKELSKLAGDGANEILAYGYGKKSNGLDAKDLRKLMFMTLMVLPFESLLYKKKKKAPALIEYLLMTSLKATTKNSHNVQIILRCSLEFQRQAQALYEDKISGNATTTRADVALIVNEAKSLWPFAIDIAMVRDLMDIDGWKAMYQDAESDFFRDADAKGVAKDASDNDKSMITNAFEPFLAKYHALYKYIEDQNIDCIWNEKPIMDGKKLMQELSLKPGPGISIMISKMKRWQFNNPQGSVEECKQFLLSS